MTTRLEKLGNRLFGKVSLHPSKTYLYSKLIDDIREHSKSVAVAADISSAHFDHAEYFNSEQYLGVDIDRNRLQSGKAKFEHDSDYTAIQADITRQIFQPNSIGMIVSTHTLSHLDPDEHLSVIEMFIQYLKPGGCLFLQVATESPANSIETQLRKSFNTVTRVDYCTAISRSFARRHRDKDGVYAPTMTGWRRYLNAVSIVILSLLERFHWPNPTFTYFKCIDRK